MVMRCLALLCLLTHCFCLLTSGFFRGDAIKYFITLSVVFLLIFFVDLCLATYVHIFCLMKGLEIHIFNSHLQYKIKPVKYVKPT